MKDKMNAFLYVGGVFMTGLVGSGMFHLLATQHVNQMESILRKDNVDPSAFIPIKEWKTKGYLEQLVSVPDWSIKSKN